MNKGFRHGARRARGLGLCAALFVAAACEEPTLPTELDEIRYSTVTIDESTLSPAAGSSLARGQSVAYDVDVRYQRSAEDVAASADVLLGFYVEMWDSVPDVGWSWLGDQVVRLDTVSGSQGSTSFSGTFTVPATASRCETYDVIRVLAIMDPASNTAYRDVETYPLTGSATIPSAGTLAYGESRTGSLDGGVVCESWTLTLGSAQSVSLSLSSPTLDTYLILQSSSGAEIARDDDSGGNLNSLIVEDLQAGTYRVLVTTYEGGEGGYVLSAGAPTGACVLAGTLTPGSGESGSLAAGDCTFTDGTFYDFWTLDLAADDSVAIDMSSTTFDTYLFLSDGSGTVIGENDDFGTGTNSRIEMQLAAGSYTVFATAFEAGLAGGYALSVESLGGGGGGTTTIASARQQPSGTAVTVNGVVTAGTGVYSPQTFYLQDGTAGIVVALGTGSSTGPFAEGDSVQVSGTVGAFSSEVQIGGAVTVTALGSAAVPSPVAVTAADVNAGDFQGELVEASSVTVDSISGVATSGSFSVYVGDAAGEFVVFVDGDTGIPTSTFTVGAAYDVTGIMSRFGSLFEIKPRRTADVQLVAAVDACVTWGSIGLNDTAMGTLEATDCAPGDGFYYEGYELDLAAETDVTITLTSTQYNAFLIVTDTTNSDPSIDTNWIAADNNSAGGTDALVVDTLPAGRYVVWVSSNGPGETGSYTLTVEESAAAPPITIAAARTQTTGTRATVIGVITAGTGTYSAQTFYMQDATAGIAVFLGTGSTAGPFAEGDSVLVSGDVGVFNTEVQLEGAVEVTVLGTVPLPAARAVTITEANSGQWQGELVEVGGLVVDSVGTASAAGYTVHTTGTGGSLAVFVDATTGIASSTFSPGATYDVTGLASVFNSVHQVKPRRTSDIQLIAAADPCMTWQPVSIGQTPSGTLATTDCAPGDGWYYEGYELTITAATPITITLTSSEFDAWLIITDKEDPDPSDGSYIIENNDGGGGTNAQIGGSIDPGSYLIWVTTNFEGETGAYQLSVQ